MSYFSRYSRLASSLVVIAGLTLAAPALAQKVNVDPSGEIMSEAIAYSPHDVWTEAGAQQMWARIQRASDIVCGGRPDNRLLDQRVAFEKCRDQTRTRAVSELNAPLVTALAAHATAVRFAKK